MIQVSYFSRKSYKVGALCFLSASALAEIDMGGDDCWVLIRIAQSVKARLEGVKG